MQAFKWFDANSVNEAIALLRAAADAGEPAVLKAGGMDLLDLMKEGIVAPARIINLLTIEALRGVQYSATGGLRLGALTNLATIAHDAQIRTSYPALADAAAHAATPQVRNAATIGGNLLQRPRCWYFRNRDFHAGPRDIAREQSQYGAIFDNAATTMVHASTPATALIAYGAKVHIAGPNGARVAALGDFLLAPDMHRASDALIAADEVLTHVSLPAPASNTKSAYHKQTERDSYDWPICDMAVVLQIEDRIVSSASIVLGWVAPTPRRAVESEQLLLGRELDENLAAEAARAAVRGATALPKNAYKVPVLEAVVRRTILKALMT